MLAGQRAFVRWGLVSCNNKLAVFQAHDIYTYLRDETEASCCNKRSCRTAGYRVTAVGVEMLVGGSWIVVPDDTIQYRTLEGDAGETAGGHWCGEIEFGLTYCAVLPPSSASASGGPRQTPFSTSPTRSPT